MKNMRKITSLLISLCLCAVLFTACGTEKKEYTASEIYAAMSEQVTMPEVMVSGPDVDDYFMNYTGIELSSFEEYVCMTAEDLLKVETVVIIKVTDGDKEALLKRLNGYVEDQVGIFMDYAPDQGKIAEKAIVGNKGDFVYLIMSAKVTELNKVLEDMIG